MLPSNRASVKRTPALDATPAALIGRLAPGVAATLAQAAAAAASYGAHLWLIGGAVRDLLLGLDPGRDIDLAVEGDAVALARTLAAAAAAADLIASHAEFGTASLRVTGDGLPAEGLVLDLAGARVESYPQPAALPQVAPADIGADFGRRDFSINAIAIRLLADDNRLRAGELRDPFDGRADLAAGRLRLLHGLSLRDDPTRILRGLRLAARLGLAPDPASADQIAAALRRGYLSLLTPERVLGELCLALDEPRPDAVLALADAWGVTPQILPGLSWNEAVAARFERRAMAEVLSAIDYRLSALHAGLLCYDLSADALAALAARYPLPAPFARLFAEIPAVRTTAQALARATRPGQIDLLLRPYTEVTIHVLHYAETGPPGQIAERYLTQIRPARAPLDGRDLQRLGVAPGPEIGRLLTALRTAYLDGEIQTRAQAEQWVQAQIS